MYGRGGVGGTALPCPLRRPYVFVRPRLPSVGYLSLVTAPSPPTQRPPLPGLRLPLGRRRLGTGALVSMVVHGLIIVLLIARGRELLQRLPGAPGQGGGGNDGAGRPQINFFTLPVAGPAAVDVPAAPAVTVSDLRALPPLKLDLPPLDVPRAALLAATAAGAVSPAVGPGAGGGQGGGAGGKEPQLTMLIALVLGLSVLALAVAWGLRGFVLRQDNGTPEMRKISDAIQEGAQAFLRRQYRTIGLLSIALGVLIYVLYAFFRKPHPGEPAAVTLALTTTLSFLFGAFCSGVAGLVGMYVAVRSNIRTASAARSSLNKALQIALRGGAVSGLFVVAMSLFGVGLLYSVLDALHFEPTKIPLMIVGYGFGASFVALFAQLGGGIYTKAADVGADLVGKVEAGIPEDDPRNPAVIAALVGDNVGDCAGRGADLFESTAAENIGAMILGAGLAGANLGVFSPAQVVGLMLFPLVARAFGLVASIIGVLVVKAREDEDPMHALNRGYMWTAVLAALGFAGGTYWLLNP